jgi:tetratricopeptide (TPR) repeat protein
MQERWQLRNSKLAAAVVALCLLPQAVFAHKPKDLEPQDQAQAQQWVEQGLDHFKNVKVTDQYITYSDSQNNYGIALPRIVWTNYTEKVINRSLYELVQWKDYSLEPNIGFVQERFTHGNEKHMQRFRAALDYLAAAARQQVKTQYDAQYQQFETQLKPWREAALKPAMPEAAREHQVLAEYAFKEKDEEKAIREYMAALAIYPTWPEGQFNLATLAGEKKYYELAVMHMKEYLELVPDSPDAQAAKDSIIIWRDKLSTLMAQEENAPAQQQSKGMLRNASAKKF